MKRRTAMSLLAGGAVAAAGGVTGALWWRERRRAAWRAGAQPPVPPTPVEPITQLAPNLYMVAGGGGNSAVWVTSRGVLVVDTKSPGRGAALLEQVRTITDKPVVYVVNTHSHGDHTAGNPVFEATAEIVVHERTARNLTEMRRNDNAGDPPRPIRTYQDHLTLFDGDESVDLHFFGRAHTGGDTFVVFRRAGFMHAGDVFADNVAPIVNLQWGGAPIAYVETMTRATAEVTGVTNVITGHGPVRPWAEFVDYRDFIRTIVTHMQTEMAAGKDAYPAMRAFVVPERFRGYKLDRLDNTFYDIYKGLLPWWHFW